MRTVVFNGSYLNLRATGIASHTLNLWRSWRALGLPVRGYLPPSIEKESFDVRPVHLRGHLARLAWNQCVLPALVRPGELLFNPVPEGPLLGASPQVTVAYDVIPLVYPEWFPRKVGYFKTIVPAALRRAKRVLCISEQTKADLVRYYGLDPERLAVVYLACDRTRFRPVAPDPVRLARYGLTPGKYFFYVGAHEPHKNLARLIEGFARLDWEGLLAVAGACDPRYTPALQERARQLGVAERVLWLDYLEAVDLPLVYGSARAFAFVSLYEGFGLPVVEAMSCGTAVLTTNRGALAEIARDGALTVDPEDCGAIATGLAQLLDDTVCRQFQERANQRAEAFSLERTARESWQALAPYL